MHGLITCMVRMITYPQSLRIRRTDLNKMPTDGMAWICKELDCQGSYGNLYDLVAHMRQSHPKCSVHCNINDCERVLLTPTSWYGHIRRFHALEFYTGRQWKRSQLCDENDDFSSEDCSRGLYCIIISFYSGGVKHFVCILFLSQKDDALRDGLEDDVPRDSMRENNDDNNPSLTMVDTHTFEANHSIPDMPAEDVAVGGCLNCGNIIICLKVLVQML